MLKIGDFSKLSRISIRNLRHYDELGLLVPENVDRFTGYRYYTEHQLITAGRISALREIDGHLVFAAPLSLTFENSALVSVSGSFLPEAASLKGAECMDAVSAVVHFLDYRNATGLVCTEITRLSCGYLLQDSSSVSTRLVPVWCIATDAGNYYVNCATGSITRG